MSLLDIRDVHASYGHVHALRGVSLTVGEGEIVTLIGANGAGKSTLLMSLFGVPRIHHGAVRFAGEDIAAMATHRIAASGLALVPEGRRIFSHMSVAENLHMGAELAHRRGLPDTSGDDLDAVFEMFPRLAERRAQRGGTLSGGEQQMLAIGRALMSKPKMLLLDEPSLGLAPLIVRQIMAALKQINAEQRLTIFLVEQDAFHALRLANRGYVMASGEIVMADDAERLLADPKIRAIYLGGAG